MAYMDIDTYDIYTTVPENLVSYSVTLAKGKNKKYVLIDDDIAYIIQTLNRKGYLTRFCCSGHYGYEFEEDEFGSYGGYIFFENPYVFDFLPDCIDLESSHILRFVFKTKPNTKERFYELNKIMYDLSEWVDALEDIS